MGTLTYRSGPEWAERFGRKRIKDELPRLDEDYQVEGYLAYQGDKFCLQYDPNSYLYISKAMDLFDMVDGSGDGGGERAGEATPRLTSIRCPSLVIGVTSDILFPVWQQQELAALLDAGPSDMTYLEIDAPYGHDTFLIEKATVGGAIYQHLAR
jgi:homoserine O-acetyltransferase